jgi:DNA-binding NtrC family response regulator
VAARAPIRFLVVDDELSIRRLCLTVGAGLGFSTQAAENADAALPLVEGVPHTSGACVGGAPDIVLLDLRLAPISGLEFLRVLKQKSPATEVAIMTGDGSIESAVQAMKLGAYDYLTKPFLVEELKVTLQRMAEKVRLTEEMASLRERLSHLEGGERARYLHGLGASDDVAPTDLETLERSTIERVFRQVKGDKRQALRLLGISRATLYRKLKRYNIGPGQAGAAGA